MKNPVLSLATSLFLITGLSASAQITVDLTTEGWTPLTPNTPGQTRQIHVSGGGSVSGMEFRIQVEGGFPDGPGKDGPNIPNVESAVDIITSTIFASGLPSDFETINNGAQFASRDVIVGAGPVSALGLLATITFDTTGLFTADSFAIKLKGTIGGDTRFLDADANPILTANISNGSISMVPEPSSAVPVASVLFVAGWFLRRNRSKP